MDESERKVDKFISTLVRVESSIPEEKDTSVLHVLSEAPCIVYNAYKIEVTMDFQARGLRLDPRW